MDYPQVLGSGGLVVLFSGKGRGTVLQSDSRTWVVGERFSGFDMNAFTVKYTYTLEPKVPAVIQELESILSRLKELL